MSKRILLVGGDLNARARISSAAEAAGAEWETSGAGALMDRLEEVRPDVLILDLDGAGREVLPRLAEAAGRGLLPPETVGYYSHVDVAVAAEAKQAGVRAIRRGRFWRDVGALLSGG
jgi:CheY-like chemotaxis protein